MAKTKTKKLFKTVKCKACGWRVRVFKKPPPGTYIDCGYYDCGRTVQQRQERYPSYRW
jgi:ribosomal protein S27E